VTVSAREALETRTAARWAVGICAFTGFWGVLTGFAIFILIRTSDPLTIVLGLIASAIASFVIESLRDTVRGEIATHPRRRIRHIIVTILTLAVFELFVLASHNAVDIFRNHEQAKNLHDDLLGPTLAGVHGAHAAPGATRDLIVLAILWMVVGAAVGTFLGLFIINEKPGQSARVRALRGGSIGVLVAVLAAPIAVFAYVLLWRTVMAFQMVFAAPAEWERQYNVLGASAANLNLAGLPLVFYEGGLLAVLGLTQLWLWSAAGKLIDVALVALVTFIAVRFKEPRPLVIVLVGFVIGIVAPLSRDIGDVFLLALLAAIVWFVPGLVLGLAAPLLDRPSERANSWSAISAALGIVVAALTAFRWHDRGSQNYVLLVLALVFFAVAVLLTRFRDIDDFWPALALCLATIATGLTFVLVTYAASFHSVLAEVSKINALPPSIAPTAEADRFKQDLEMLDSSWSQPPRFVPDPYQKGPFETALSHVGSMSPDDREKTIALERPKLEALRAKAMESLVALDQQKRGYIRRAADPLSADEFRRAVSEAHEEYRSFTGGSEGAGLARLEARIEAARLAASLVPGLYGQDPLYSSLDSVRHLSGAALNTVLVREQNLVSDRRNAEGWAAFFLGHNGHDDESHWWSYEKTLQIAAAQLTTIDSVLADLSRLANLASLDSRTDLKLQDAEREWERRGVPEQLEVSLAGSFAFWVTVGLLSAWAIRRRAADWNSSP